VNEQEFDLSQCSVLRLLLPHINRVNRIDKTVWAGGKAFKNYLEVACGKAAFKKSRLIDLLHELPSRESHIPRDKLYSLRSLALDGASVNVDYDSSNEYVMLQFANLLQGSLCFCTWAQLDHGFDRPEWPGDWKFERAVWPEDGESPEDDESHHPRTLWPEDEGEQSPRSMSPEDKGPPLPRPPYLSTNELAHSTLFSSISSVNSTEPSSIGELASQAERAIETHSVSSVSSVDWGQLGF
jgi:hypothetical protein